MVEEKETWRLRNGISFTVYLNKLQSQLVGPTKVNWWRKACGNRGEWQCKSQEAPRSAPHRLLLAGSLAWGCRTDENLPAAGERAGSGRRRLGQCRVGGRSSRQLNLADSGKMKEVIRWNIWLVAASRRYSVNWLELALPQAEGSLGILLVFCVCGGKYSTDSGNCLRNQSTSPKEID